MVIVAVCATYGRLGFGLRFDRGIAIAIGIASGRDRDPLTHILGKQKWASLLLLRLRGGLIVTSVHRLAGSHQAHNLHVELEVSKPKVSSRKLVAAAAFGSRVKHRSAGAGAGGLSNDPVRPLTHGPLGIWEGFAQQ